MDSDKYFVVNLTFRAEIEGFEIPNILRFPYSIEWQELERSLKAECGLFPFEKVSVVYIDEENDEINLSSQDEFKLALEYAKKCSNTLSLKMRGVSNQTPANPWLAPPPGTAVQPPPPPYSSTVTTQTYRKTSYGVAQTDGTHTNGIACQTPKPGVNGMGSQTERPGGIASQTEKPTGNGMGSQTERPGGIASQTEKPTGNGMGSQTERPGGIASQTEKPVGNVMGSQTERPGGIASQTEKPAGNGMGSQTERPGGIASQTEKPVGNVIGSQTERPGGIASQTERPAGNGMGSQTERPGGIASQTEKPAANVMAIQTERPTGMGSQTEKPANNGMGSQTDKQARGIASQTPVPVGKGVAIQTIRPGGVYSQTDKIGKPACMQTMQVDQQDNNSQTPCMSDARSEPLCGRAHLGGVSQSMELRKKEKSKKRKHLPYYSALAAEVGTLYDPSQAEITKRCHQVTPPASLESEEEKAPKWFVRYMEKYRKDLVKEVSKKVTLQVLKHLDETRVKTTDEVQAAPVADALGHVESDIEHEVKAKLDDHMDGEGYRYSRSHLKLLRRYEHMKQKEQRRKQKELRRQEKELKQQKRKRGVEVAEIVCEDTNVSSKKEKLDLPQCRQIKLDAKCIGESGVQDGAYVSAGTKFTKKWKIRNTGDGKWNNTTKLVMIWGNLPATKTEIQAPHLSAAEEGIVEVEFIAPEQPGRYQSNWRMLHDGVRFGHRVVCRVTVQERELLEPQPVGRSLETIVKNDDKEMEELCEKTEKDLVVSSEEAPAATPICDEATKEIPEETSLPAIQLLTLEEGTNKEEEEKDLTQDVVELDSFSECSYSSTSSDDFFLVPLPDCFNTEIPLEKLTRSSTSTSLNHPDETTPLISADSKSPIKSTVTGYTVDATVLGDDTDDDNIPAHTIIDMPVECAATVVVPLQEPLQPEQAPAIQDPTDAVCTDDKGTLQEERVEEAEEEGETSAVNTEALDETDDIQTDGAANDEGDEQETEESVTNIVAFAKAAADTAAGTAVVAAKAFVSTAKDVFHTWQARKQYVPPERNWNPPNNNWEPTTNDFELQEQKDWSPPQPATPMETLIIMGFANREVNQRLLNKYHNDIQLVVAELVQDEENDWHANRH